MIRQRNTCARCCVMVLLLEVLISGWSLTGSTATRCPPDPPGMGVLIPWYIDPSNTAAYRQLASYGPRCSIFAIITGDNSGPPTSDFPLYTAGFKTLYDSGINLFGYVHTMADVGRRIARPQATVITEINSWFDRFGSMLLGIFFDEVDGGASNVNPRNYYSALANAVYARNNSARVVFNPGAKLTCTVADLSDIYVRYEGYAADWASDAASVTCDCSTQSTCGLLLHGQANGSRARLTQLVDQAAQKAFSYIYFTDDVMQPDPWDSLASYFGTMMDIIAPVTSPSPLPRSPLPKPPPSPQPPAQQSPRQSPPPPPSPKQPPSPSPKQPPPPSPKQPPSPSPKQSPPPSPSPKPLPSPLPKSPPAKSPPARSPSPMPPSPPSPPRSTLWRPSGVLRWQWQLSGEDFRPMLKTRPQVIDVDVDVIPQLLSQGVEVGVSRSSYKLICYFSVGTYEPARVTADAALNISWTALAQQLGGSSVPGPLYLSYMDPPFSEERWLAIDRADTRSALVNQVMIPRMRKAVAAGCDAIEMDNVDVYSNYPAVAGKRGVTEEQQLLYNAALLDAAHSLGLSAGLKNALGLLDKRFADGRAVATSFDWFLNEQCWQYNECDYYGRYVTWNASVFGVEYCDARKVFGSDAQNLKPDCVCPLANGPTPGAAAVGGNVTLNWLIKTVALNAVGLECREYCNRPGVVCIAPPGGNVLQCVKNTPLSLCPSYSVTRR